MTWLTWSLLSAAFAAATAILAKLGVEKLDSNLATAIRTTVVVVFAWLFAFSTWQPTALSAISAPAPGPSSRSPASPPAFPGYVTSTP